MIWICIKPPNRPPREPYDARQVLLEVDLQEYLASLRSAPSLARLGTLDIYDDTRIEGDWLDGLIDEIPRVRLATQEGTLAMAPPDRVGVTWDEDVKRALGVVGFIVWLDSLLELAHEAKNLRIPLLALGN